MASKTEIANLALTHLGVGVEIANIDTEKSEEASAARRVYNTALDVILKEAPWPFATRVTTLALVEEEPTTEWLYSYRYPVDCVELRRILSGVRQDYRQSQAKYHIASDASGFLIYTDEEDAQVEYTVRMDNPHIYSADFTLAFSYLLAALMAPRLTKGDPFKLGERAFFMYERTLSRAIANATNEEVRDEEPLSEMERDRE